MMRAICQVTVKFTSTELTCSMETYKRYTLTVFNKPKNFYMAGVLCSQPIKRGPDTLNLFTAPIETEEQYSRARRWVNSFDSDEPNMVQFRDYQQGPYMKVHRPYIQDHVLKVEVLVS